MTQRDDSFKVPYPCRVIVSKESVVRTGKGTWKWIEPVQYVAVVSDSGEMSLAVFTTQEAVQTFLDSAEEIGEVPVVSVPERDLLLAILEAAQAGGVTQVVFDPPTVKGWKRRTWPIGHVIQLLKNNQERL